MRQIKQISRIRSTINTGIAKLESKGVHSPKSSTGAFGGTTVKVVKTPVGLATIARHTSGCVLLSINGEEIFSSTYGGGAFYDDGGWSYTKWCGGFKHALRKYDLLLRAIA